VNQLYNNQKIDELEDFVSPSSGQREKSSDEEDEKQTSSI